MLDTLKARGLPPHIRPRLHTVMIAGPVIMGRSSCGRYVVGKGMRADIEIPTTGVAYFDSEADARSAHAEA